MMTVGGPTSADCLAECCLSLQPTIKKDGDYITRQLFVSWHEFAKGWWSKG